MKYLLDIEIPVGNKQNVIYSCLIPSLSKLAPIKDSIRFLLNFNGKCLEEDIGAVLNELNKFNFSYEYIVKQYEWVNGKVDNLTLRLDTHNIVNEHAPYFLLFDDDILILNEHYGEILLDGINKMEEDKFIGAIQLDAIRPRKEKIFYIPNYDYPFFTSNGLLFRNIKLWNNEIVPKKYTFLHGGEIDALLCFSRMEIGLLCYTYWCNDALHMELQQYRDGEIIEGWKFWNWNLSVDNNEKTVTSLFVPFRQDSTDYEKTNSNAILWDKKKIFPQFIGKDCTGGKIL